MFSDAPLSFQPGAVQAATVCEGLAWPFLCSWFRALPDSIMGQWTVNKAS